MSSSRVVAGPFPYLRIIMSDFVTITVPYRDTEKEYEAEFQPTGYTHRFRVEIEGVEVFFEPDEEKQYRAIIPVEQQDAARKIDPALFQAVAKTLQEALG